MLEILYHVLEIDKCYNLKPHFRGIVCLWVLCVSPHSFVLSKMHLGGLRSVDVVCKLPLASIPKQCETFWCTRILAISRGWGDLSSLVYGLDPCFPHTVPMIRFGSEVAVDEGCGKLSFSEMGCYTCKHSDAQVRV